MVRYIAFPLFECNGLILTYQAAKKYASASASLVGRCAGEIVRRLEFIWAIP